MSCTTRKSSFSSVARARLWLIQEWAVLVAITQRAANLAAIDRFKDLIVA